jgi:preprotein translocase subunit YajC
MPFFPTTLQKQNQKQKKNMSSRRTGNFVLLSTGMELTVIKHERNKLSLHPTFIETFLGFFFSTTGA